MTGHLRQAFDWDIETRIADQSLPRAAAAFETTEFVASPTRDRSAVVWERDGVSVTAFEVDHGEKIHPAFGFKVSYRGRAVLISGDTRPSETLARQAAGVDLLVHQVAAARPALLERAASWRDILDHHTTPEQAGALFARAAPKLAVYTHLVLLTDGSVPPPSPEELVARTRTTYAGPLVVGADLMRFTIGPDGVTQQPN
jgi:ribonuclease Z